jgi:hypothetical protein
MKRFGNEPRKKVIQIPRGIARESFSPRRTFCFYFQPLASNPRGDPAEGGREPPGVVEVGKEAGGKGRNGCSGMISQSYL